MPPTIAEEQKFPVEFELTPEQIKTLFKYSQQIDKTMAAVGELYVTIVTEQIARGVDVNHDAFACMLQARQTGAISVEYMRHVENISHKPAGAEHLANIFYS